MPRKRKKGATKPGPSRAMTAILGYLKSHRKAEYRDVVKAAAKNGHKIFPVMYGRAQALLGIVRMKRRAKRGAPAAGPRRRGRPAMRVAGRRGRRRGVRIGSLAELQKFLVEYEAVRRDRDALREAVETAHRVIGKVLE